MQAKSVWICHGRPKIVTGPAASAIAPSTPSTSRISPGTKYSQLGL